MFANLLSLATFVSVISARTLVARNSTACNNSPDLCSKSYGEITHLGAHDSPFVRDSSTDYTTSGNQYFNTTVQLEAGVRLVTAQVYNVDGEYHLCHSSCELLDAGTLENWLSEIKTWMDANTNDVVTVLLVNSDNLSADDLATSFTSSGISSYAYTPSSTTTPISPSSWPTLQSLITANTRLITFIASLSSTSTSAPYLLDEFSYIFENNYDVTSPSNFTCTPARPSNIAGDTSTAISDGYLPFMNHFLDEVELLGIEIPDADNVTSTNSPSTSITGALGTSAGNCSSQYGQHPTFILVDFFDQGPAIDTVDSLNGVTDAVGRTTPPAASTSSSASGQTSGAEKRSSTQGGSGAVVALLGVLAYMVLFV